MSVCLYCVVFLVICKISCVSIMMCSWQELNLARVRKLASTHNSSPALSRLAKIGSKGKYFSNLYRDLAVLLRREGVVEPTMISVPMRLRSKMVVNMSWPMIAPHEMIHYLHQHGMTKEMLLGNMDMDSFWGQFMKEPGLDFSEFANCVDGLIPIRFHGDEGTWSRGKSIMVWSIGGVSHHHDVYQTRFLLTVLPSTKYAYQDRVVDPFVRRCGKKSKRRKMKVNMTFDAASKFLAWSLQVAASGVFPDEPFAGASVW